MTDEMSGQESRPAPDTQARPGYVTVDARDIAIALNGYAGFTGDPVSFASELHERLRRTVFADQAPEPQPAPGDVLSKRFFHLASELENDAAESNSAVAQATRGIARLIRKTLDTESAEPQPAPELPEPVAVAGVLCHDYPSVVTAMQAEIDRERVTRLHLAGERDEARSDYSRLRRVLLDEGLSDTVARRRCLAVIATAGTPPVDVPLDVQRRHRPGDCQCTPCKEAASE
jgi:uncharacterized protein (DUF2267 family)